MMIKKAAAMLEDISIKCNLKIHFILHTQQCWQVWWIYTQNQLISYLPLSQSIILLLVANTMEKLFTMKCLKNVSTYAMYNQS